MLQVTGRCTSAEKAVEFFEKLPDNMTDEAVEMVMERLEALNEM